MFFARSGAEKLPVSARRFASRPPEVWSLTLLTLVGGLSAAGGALAPMSAHAPVGLDEALALASVVLSAGLFLAGRRAHPWMLGGLLALVEALASLLVAESRTAAGVLVVGMYYPWLAAYAAMFRGPLSAIAASVGVSAGFASGVLASGIPHLVAAWGTVTLSSAGAAFVLFRLSAALRRQSETDPLTGALTRAGLDRLVARQPAWRSRPAGPPSVVVVDLDGLKAVNDRFGHAAGDAVLRTSVEQWRPALRRADVLARTGGDEFVFVLPDTDAGAAQRLVQRLAELGQAPFSAGVAQRGPTESFGEVLARADSAMYANKRARLDAGLVGARGPYPPSPVCDLREPGERRGVPSPRAVPGAGTDRVRVEPRAAGPASGARSVTGD